MIPLPPLDSLGQPLASMASKPPKSSLDSRASVKHLIVDSSPLLTAPISSLRGIATNYLVTPDVVLELRDKNGRNVLDEARLQLPADYHQEEDKEEEGVEMRRKIDGFQVREPSAEAIAKSKLHLFTLSLGGMRS